MEAFTTPDHQDKTPQCISCGNPDIVHGYPNALCHPCRTSFTKLTVPLWVKLFGGLVLLLLIVALFEIPANFTTAIALERAEKSEAQGNYLTEQQTLENIIDKAPDAVEVSGHLFIAAFYNQDYTTFGKMGNVLAGKKFDDAALLGKINDIITKSNSYFPTDSFRVVMNLYPKGINAIPDAVFKKYLGIFTNDTYAHYCYASRFFDADYKKCDSLLNPILANEAEYVPALHLKSIVKRELNQLDSSVFYCDKILAVNHQYSPGLSSKARTMMKQGKKTEGLKMALNTYALDKKEPYTIATLALAYHINGKTHERDALITQTSKDSVSSSYMSYVKDVMSGKTKFN